MLANRCSLRRFFLILAVALALPFAASMAAAQSVPMLVQAETMTLVAPMTAGYDIAATGGRFISPTSGSSTSSPVRSAYTQISVPTAGTYYLWARIGGPTIASDALYVGIDGSFARIFPTRSVPGHYEWIRVETSNGSGAYGFSLGAGNHEIQVGYGEIGARLDAVYLTANAAEVPSFASSMRVLIEAEALNRAPPMTVGSDSAALGEQYLSPTSGSSTTNPVRSAHVPVGFPAGTYYLWARIAGPTISSDALYLGIDTSFDRVFPSAQGPYQWVRVETANGSGAHGFNLAAGDHTVQVGYGEIGTRLDAVYLTVDAAEVPTFAPMRLTIEAETMNLEPPMTVGSDTAASGGQYISPTSGTNSTVPVREAWTTVNAPSADTYYLWARLKGASIASDALYIGFDNAWHRAFPSAIGVYEWVRVEATAGSVEGFPLSAGSHIIQVGHGEIGARLDALYVTDSASDIPAGAGTPPPPPSGACALPDGGYEGYGRNTTGGLGQTIYRVTNRNNSGAGSLRDAVSQSNRCVVFDVGGTFNLSSAISVTGNNITIDGFTAPSPGVTLPAGLYISSRNNVIVRGIRVRAATDDGFRIYGSTNVVLDHCSVDNFGDGAIDITESSRDVTVQWCILGPEHGDTHNFLNLIAYRAYRITEHHNLFYRGRDRSPNVSWIRDPDSTPPDVVLDFRANLVWGFYQRGTHMRDGWGNIVNNYYYGVGSGTSDGDAIDHQDADGGRWYTAGNYSRNGHNLNDNGNWGSAHPVPPVTTQSAQAAAQLILDNAGARGPNFGLDAVDQSFINSIRSTGL